MHPPILNIPTTVMVTHTVTAIHTIPTTLMDIPTTLMDIPTTHMDIPMAERHLTVIPMVAAELGLLRSRFLKGYSCMFLLTPWAA